MNHDDLERLDARLQGKDQEDWTRFYEDRARPIPFFVDAPDESLAEWLEAGRSPGGRALELGCGNGRNAVFLARNGYAVDAIDYAPTAIEWARQRVAEHGADVRLLQRSVFDLDLPPASYNLVYDSGCFHHIAPHRRPGYVDLVARALRPGGWFGMVCFRPEGGSGWSDDEVYERGSLGGGLGYSEERLREIWSRALQVRSIRPMRSLDAAGGLFGLPFLWTLWAQRAPADSE